MKKIFCFAIALITVVGAVFGQKVSEQEALNLSAQFLQKKTPGLTATTPPTMETIVTQRLKNGSPAYYILQASEGEGYVVMAAERAAEPILGYSSTGNFDPTNIPPALQFLLDDYRDQLEFIDSKHLHPTPQITQKWNNLTETSTAENTVIVQPLIKTKWGQGQYYNSQCPTGGSLTANALTGCVATTMAQIMYYWSFPIREQTTLATAVDNDPSDGISGTFTTQVGGGYHWGNMSTQLNQFSTPVEVAEVANLMYDCGVAADMNYGFGASGATDYHASHGMHNFFGYEDPYIYLKEDFSTSEWLTKLKTNLNAGYPIFYAGDGNGAHAWVVDGYDDENKFHMNWGWDGSSLDGYWLLTNLNTATFDFNSHQRMFVPKPGGGCVPFAVLSGPQTNPNVEVAHWISAASTVPPLPGFQVVFNAREEIVLTHGFFAAQGSDFKAILLGCDGLVGEDPNAEERTESEEQAVAIAKPGEINIAPNPFSGSTTVSYVLENEQQVTMSLMDATGKLVATPMPVQTQSEGEHQFTLEAGSLPTGMYFLVMQMGEKRETKRLILTQ
jgi:hypothetical protein